MAKFNLDYYSGENFYSDGDIEKEILKIVKTQGSYESMENVPFPVLYHLSRVRENILNCIRFRRMRPVWRLAPAAGRSAACSVSG